MGIAYTNSRSLHWSSGLLSGNHEVAVGCVRSSSYTIQWVSGNERRLSAPRHVSYITGADLSAKPVPVAIEPDVTLERMLQRARYTLLVEPAAGVGEPTR